MRKKGNLILIGSFILIVITYFILKNIFFLISSLDVKNVLKIIIDSFSITDIIVILISPVIATFFYCKEKLRSWVIEKLRGYAVFIESFILFSIDYFILKKYFLISYSDNDLNTIIHSFSKTDIITILTSSAIAIGFLYYIGYSIAARRKGLILKHPLQYSITFNGSILFLGVFLSLLSASGHLNIMLFILINIIFVVGFAFSNEVITENKDEQVTLKRNLGKTLENLALYDVTNEDYKFKDKNGNRYIIPILEVKEIRISSVLFDWYKIPGSDSSRLKEFLRNKFYIDWVKTAKIEKMLDGKVINVFTEQKSLSLILNDERNEVNPKIDNCITDKLIAEMENGSLNIYNAMKPEPKKSWFVKLRQKFRSFF